jgi:hypothetical protein
LQFYPFQFAFKKSNKGKKGRRHCCHASAAAQQLCHAWVTVQLRRYTQATQQRDNTREEAEEEVKLMLSRTFLQLKCSLQFVTDTYAVAAKIHRLHRQQALPDVAAARRRIRRRRCSSVHSAAGPRG